MTGRTSRALAAAMLLASTVPAQAQSTVTVYGVVDAAMSLANAGGPAMTRKRMDSAVGSGSRLGFRGNEDLGGGLRAMFTLEMGIDARTGNFQQGGIPWGRQIFVGLGGPGWAVTLGRQYSPSLLAVSASDAFAQNYWGSSTGYGIGTLQSPGSAALAGAACQGATARINNAVLGSYANAGFTGRLLLGTGDENQRGTGRVINPSVSYSQGPLMLTTAYTRLAQCAPEIGASASATWQDEATVGGSYDFGIAKLFAGYYLWNPSERNRASAPTYRKHQTYWIGARIPVGAMGTLITQAAQQKQDRGGVDAKGLSLGITYEHALSKRTRVYTSAARMWNDENARFSLTATTAALPAAAVGADPRVISFGLTHSF